MNKWLEIQPGKWQGIVPIQPSKSLSHRGLICAALAKGISRLSHVGNSLDIDATRQGLEALGLAEFRSDGTVLGLSLIHISKPIIGENAFAHEAGIHQHGVLAERTTYEILTPESVGISQNNIVLGKHSGKRAFQAHLNSLGYELTPEQLNDAFERFKVLADKKRDILDRDLDILIRGEQVEASGRYGLVDFVINSSNITSSMAKIKLSVDDKEIEGVGLGYGPIDASFKAINDLIGRDYELTDYSLRSVTEGEDALGEAMVKMVYRGAAVTGRGVSTDILEASIKAYVNAVNKMKDKRD